MSRHHRHRTSFVLLSGAVVLSTALATTASYATGHGGSPALVAAAGSERAVKTPGGDLRGFYDARDGGRAAARSGPVGAGQTVLYLDSTTGTVRSLARLDGFLTGPSHKPAARIALHYVAQHHAELGLARGDLATFHLARDYRDITGAHHLFFVQRIKGHAVISNGLTASVNKQGHLLVLGGSPVSKARAGGVTTPSSPRLGTSAQALSVSRASAGTPSGADLRGDSATEGLFVTPHGLRLAWRTVVMSSAQPTLQVVDAATSGVLLQRPLVDDANGPDSTGSTFSFFPKAPRGGLPKTVDFTKLGWLSGHAKVLSGNNSHAYSDVNDDQRVESSEEVHARSGHSWGYLLKPFHLKFATSFCGKPWPCSWNPDQRLSWRRNRAQNATQVFFFVNNWHDHLLRAPIGFDEAAGNFQRQNTTGHGKGHDAVDTQTDDGANTDHGLPDANHIDNANMATPPDGHSPRMQMYLQHAPGASYPAGDPFSPTNVGDEADTVYHEYTHGLSNRLNVDVQGASTLGGVQAGAMGEAWSDWYAMDYLVDQHLQKDKRGKVDVRLFKYDGDGVALDRTEPIDCPVGSKAKLCTGGSTGQRGGYTYRSYAHVAGSAEVHGDGEIWAQTLWSLRYGLGSTRIEALVTRAMELAPYNPSFLDMRNAILVADTSLFGGKDRASIWKVFASRGMGFYAGSFGGDDTAPGASFARPPQQVRTAVLSGTVSDADSGQPVAGVPVTLAFQGAGVANPTAITDATGHYSISGVPQGHYSKLVVSASGYQETVASVDVGTATTADLKARRDWAASNGGASVSAFTGVDLSSYGCGPRKAIDLSASKGWLTNNAAGVKATATGSYVPKSLTVDLTRPINLTGFGVDPSTTCGQGASASTAGYQIETSPDGAVWTIAAAGTFTPENDGVLTQVTPTAGTAAVRYVRFTMLSNQTPDPATNCPAGAYTGCTYTALTELEVFGLAAG